MNFDQLNYQLLARYMSGECSEEEEQIILKWTQKEKNKEKLEQFERIWDAAASQADNGEVVFDVREEWDRLQSRIENKDTDKTSSLRSNKFRETSIHSMTQTVVRVAAIFLVAGLIGVLTYQNWYQPKPQESKETVLREISTDNAQRANFTLGDGTHVLLNAGSTVKVPNQFDSDRRDVYLEGEAYFEVVKNPEKPFVIHSRKSRIEVLGTSFSVRSYTEDQQVRVVVEEGEVALKSSEEDNSEETRLSANELGSFHLGDNTIEKRTVEDMELYMSWREGFLKFQEEPMENVAKDFERRYGVEVIFEDSEIKQYLLTAYLKSRSLQNVLDVIATSLEIEYELKDEEVIFKK